MVGHHPKASLWKWTPNYEPHLHYAKNILPNLYQVTNIFALMFFSNSRLQRSHREEVKVSGRVYKALGFDIVMVRIIILIPHVVI